MNKIYKVIWNKAKHCYVVTSELAKRNTKGCGARGLRKAAVTLTVAAALMGGWSYCGTIAHAATVEVPSNSQITISDNQSDNTYYLNGSDIKFTVANSGKVNGISGNSANTIKNNIVIIDGGTVETVVYGGNSHDNGEVANNLVKVTNGTVEWSVLGGRTSGAGTVTHNQAVIERGAVGAASGGSSYGNADVIENSVELRKVECDFVYGGVNEIDGSSGIVNNNSVTIIDGTVQTNFYGGFTYGNGDVSNNNVKIDNSKLRSGSAGMSYGNGDIKGNRVEVSGSTVSTSIDGGGTTGSGKVLNNQVTIEEGTIVDGNIDGASTYGDGVVSGNSAIIDNSTVKYTVRGGFAGGNGNVTENSVTIKNSTIGYYEDGYASNGYVYGGYAESTGAVIGNHVVIDNSTVGYYDSTLTVEGDVIGGHSYEGKVAGNIVELKEGQVTNIRGGENYSTENTNALQNNEVTIEGGTVHNNVHGAYAYGNSDLINNKITINGGTVLNEIIAAYAEGNGEVSNNVVTINSKSVGAVDSDGNLNGSGGVIGGYSYGSGNVRGNKVVLNGGNIVNVTGGSNNYSAGIVENNSVIINGGTVQYFVDGGGTYGTEDVKNNRIEVNGGEIFGEVRGGFKNVYEENTGIIEGNKVIINGGTLNDKIHGGASYGYSDVKNNYVEINGGIINGNVYGGRTNTGNVTDNTVVLKGISIGGDVYGGFGYDSESDIVTGNTLILSKAENTVGGDVQNFETIKLADTVTWAEGKTVLTANQFTENSDGTKATLDISEATDFSNATSGTMTMLASNTDDNLNALTLKYAGGTAELNTDNQLQVIKAGTEKTDKKNGVTVSYNTGEHIVYIDGASNYKKVNYSVADVAKAVSFSEMEWGKGHTATEYNYSGIKNLDTKEFAISKPETIAENASMTLLQANSTLKDMAEQENGASYTIEPIAGVTMDAILSGKIASTGGNVTYTATSNQASKLTFGDVEWKDSGALIDHKTTLSNVSFNGAAVDTTKIGFTNKESLKAGQKMTLVSDFGDSVGTITGSKYKVGTAYEGKGHAELQDSNLIFKTDTGAGDLSVSDETHNTVMTMEAGMAMLAAGNEHVGKAVEGLADLANRGEDGTSVFASVGGGGNRYETNSHVNANTWNALVAVGGKKNLGNAALEYGIFGEYGKTNYTLHGDVGRGDGSAHYAGGGLLAKWVNNANVYAEASFRLGRLSDNASDILHDGEGNGYGYNQHANYYGGHVGIGKVLYYDGGKSLDLYGKYFHTRRDGMDFTAKGDIYSLDSVTSSILRVGARYGATNKKWNWYGGLAYEYEFDGQSSGNVNGQAIRAASVKGSSARAEIGMRMFAGQTSPWQADISLYGYAGKHRGAGGNISVTYTF